MVDVDYNQTKRTCSNCWHPIALDGARYCPTCGVDIEVWEPMTTSESEVENAVVLDEAIITVGRATDNRVQLPHPAVSAHHARLEWRADNERWYVVDENSARGTFINYRKVPHGLQGMPINPYTDTLWIAPYAFRLVDSDRPQQQAFAPARLRLDAVNLVRMVKHERSGNMIPILNLEPTPLTFRPGEFVALVGGSGAGKSTLMKALLGLAPAQTGTVYVGGRPLIKDGKVHRFEAMHTVVGYVPQDDVVHHDLTSLEALDYVARFRLAPGLSRQERLEYIQETLRTIDLWPHRDKLIRKLSGGQRKRVNIALELLAHPRLLFLDEPTSGLDPGLDLSIMELLRAWATDPADPRTIILVTHATENVTRCKYVAFMAAGGHVVYFGPPEAALHYFGADRFAEIYRQVGAYQLPDLAGAVAQDGQPAGLDVRELVTKFRESNDYFRYVESRQLDALDVREPEPVQEDESHRLLPDAAARVRFRRQLGILTGRYWKLIRRDRMNFIILMLQGPLVAALLWAVARPDTFQPRGADSAQTVLFIMACAAVWLGILNATKEIVKEQDIYARERRYGLGAAAYVFSKMSVLAAIGALQIGTLLFLLTYQITFPGRGTLAAWSPAWLEWFLTLELALASGLSVGLFISAAARSIDSATAVMFGLLLMQVMFAGLFFPDAAWADILSVFTFSRWGLEGVAITADLNGLLRQAIGNVYEPDKAYTFSALNLLGKWAILAGYVSLFTAGTILLQTRKR